MPPAPAIAIYSPWDISVRELGGGAWFFMSLWLSVAFVSFVIRERDRTNPIVLAVATGLATFAWGSAIRAFLTWMQFRALGNGWDAAYWIQTWPWFGTSVILNISGAAACIYFLAPDFGFKPGFLSGSLAAMVFSVATAVFVPWAIWMWF